MSRGLVGAGLGAAGATVYLKPEIVQDYVKEVVFGRTSQTLSSGVGKELEHLQRLVEDLSRQVAAGSKQGAVTVVHTSSRDSTGTYVLYGCTAAGLGILLYFRVLRGWTFGDMLYATRRGLRDGLVQVSTGLEQLGTRVQEVKSKLQERIAALMHKQEEMLGVQAEMQAALGGVGRDVEHTRGQVGQIHAVVMDLEASMAEVGVNQRHANHGIYVLCKAVSEVMVGSNIPSKTELIEYTQQHPVWAASVERLQGLESLLPPCGGGGGSGLRHISSSSAGHGRDENASPERRGPFLLPVGRTSSGSGAGEEAAPRKVLSEGSGMFGSATSGVSAGIAAGAIASGSFHTPALPFSVPVAYPSSVSVGGASISTAGVYSSSDW